MILAVIIPDNATVLDVARQAKASNLHIINNGQRTVLSPVVPPGWFKMAVKVKNADGVLDAYEQTDSSASCCDMNEAVA